MEVNIEGEVNENWNEFHNWATGKWKVHTYYL